MLYTMNLQAFLKFLIIIIAFYNTLNEGKLLTLMGELLLDAQFHRQFRFKPITT